uniref:Uncharacterized protein n=1 Tax=Romanomermis culicivorax TaxID=13658 RepID=A0A915HT02_ROMCU
MTATTKSKNHTNAWMNPHWITGSKAFVFNPKTLNSTQIVSTDLPAEIAFAWRNPLAFGATPTNRAPTTQKIHPQHRRLCLAQTTECSTNDSARVQPSNLQCPFTANQLLDQLQGYLWLVRLETPARSTAPVRPKLLPRHAKPFSGK